MTSLLAIITCLWTTLLMPFGLTQTSDDFQVTVRKLSDRAIVLTVDRGEATNITALNTEKGIVVIDSETAPVFASLIRERIEKEFGRKDFAYLINTHGHGDHTYGNQVFSDAVIIGHENVPVEMVDRENSRLGMVAQLKNAVQVFGEKLKSMDAESESTKALAKQVKFYKAMSESLGQGFTLTPPTLTFSDRMTLYLGDITLDLSYFGRSHSKSDILIHCPEEGLWITGDLFYAGHDLYVDSDRIAAFPRWIANMESMLADKDKILHIVPGHGDFLPVEELESKYAFVKEQNEKYAGKKSALNICKKAYDESGMESAIEKLKELYAKPDEYFVLYFEFDQFAYRLMLDDKVEEALDMFKVLAEYFPDLYTAYDSLGEAYMRLNDKEAAIKNFKKSLELNPDNSNATEKLQELENDK